MKRKQVNPSALQWHPGLYAALQIDLEDAKDNLVFENEHQIGTKPKAIDVLIIKKNNDIQIEKNIGRIFRTYNIIEYKSPDDYLSIDDFYKVYAYACLYKCDSPTVNEISATDITITFIANHYPNKMLQLLKKERNFTIQKQEKGIYYLLGDFFPIQLVITSKLTKETNFWLHYLTNNLKTKEEAQQILEEYRLHNNNKLYKSIMNLIVNANLNIFEEEKGNMCEALYNLLKDEVDELASEMASEMASEKLKNKIHAKLSKGKSILQIAEELEESEETIMKLISY